MGIIAAHRDGLIEQLDEAATALAGRSCDHGQRAVVLHHLYNHSRGIHVWALAEARQALRIGAGVAALRQRCNRWGWAFRQRERVNEALEQLAEALGRASAARTAAAYRAYRLSADAALRLEAEAQLAAPLLASLDACHRARRLGGNWGGDASAELDLESEQLAAGAVDVAALKAAWEAIASTGLGRVARRLLGEHAMDRSRARDERRNHSRLEQLLLADRALPASFRANPAQHFYALQQQLRERRRQQWREACDREPDAFELAA